MDESVLSLRGIEKSYPGLKALDHVDFALRRGEVRALMGRNGAGKSTLVRIISGAEHPDSGQMAVAGKSVAFRGPNEALDAGIATVHQELTIVPGLSVAENILLGRWPARRGQIDIAAMRTRAAATLQRLGTPIDPRREAGTLSIAEQQIIEIARALSFDPAVLILDEPTSSLPGHEVEALLATVRRLSAQGVAVIYVSHRMDEIARVADSVTVLRDGRVVADLAIADAPASRIAALMSGEEFKAGEDFRPPAPGPETVLRVRGVDAGMLRAVEFDLHRGEVIGIAGLLGAGRSELLRVIAGIEPIETGTIEVSGRRLARRRYRGVAEAIAAGVSLVPEDRKREGLVLDLSIASNLVMSCLGKVARLGIINRAAERSLAEASRSATSIKAADLGAAAKTLSGGNQQKIVLARCINSGARVLLLDEPTRGVDVHAKAQIYALVRDFAAGGGAVLLVSSEYDELLMLSQRILFIERGRLGGEVRPDQIDLPTLMARLLDTSLQEDAA